VRPLSQGEDRAGSCESKEEIAIDTMVKIVSSPSGPACILPTGETLLGVVRIAWCAEVDDIARADVTIAAATVEVEGKLQLMVCHPATGRLKEVASIAFADGSTWSPGDSHAPIGAGGHLESQG